MSEISLRENKMGSSPIGKLLFRMSLPAIFSMLIQSLYNIVDSIFVAKVSADAFLAVNTAFPLQMIIIALALGVGVGTNSIVARKLGEGRKDEADKFAQTGLFLALCASVLCVIIGVVLPKPFMGWFTANEAVIDMGNQYLMICMVCSFGIMIEQLISKTLQATGNMTVPMISQLIGALTNIALDPIFIFVAKLGAMGAAIATVIGQIAAMVFSIIMAARRTHIIQIFFKKFKLNAKKVLTILHVGAPVMVMNAVGGFVTIVMNIILKGYSEMAINVLAVYFKLQSFIFMPVFGLTQGALPIMAFNYGAGRKDRYKKTFMISISVALVILGIGTLIFQLIPETLISMFESGEELRTMGAVALRAISWSFIPAALGIVVTNAYQAIGYGMTSLVMSILRQVALIIPAAILFGKWWGLDKLWFCYPFAEIITVIIFTPLLFHFVNKAFRKKEMNAEALNNIADENVTEE